FHLEVHRLAKLDRFISDLRVQHRPARYADIDLSDLRIPERILANQLQHFHQSPAFLNFKDVAHLHQSGDASTADENHTRSKFFGDRHHGTVRCDVGIGAIALHHSRDRPAERYRHHQIPLQIAEQLRVLYIGTLPDAGLNLAEVQFAEVRTPHIVHIDPHEIHNVIFVDEMIFMHVLNRNTDFADRYFILHSFRERDQ